MSQYIQEISRLTGTFVCSNLRTAAVSSMVAHEDSVVVQDRVDRVIDLLERIAESQRVQTAILESIAEDKGIKKTWQADGATHHTLNRSLNEVSFADNE